MQIAFQVLIAIGLQRTKPSPTQPTTLSSPPSLSVIIAAHNEAENLQRNLDSVLNQDYPDFEVVVVDHGSTDHTAEVLEAFQKTHQNLRVCPVVRSAQTIGKKEAIAAGIQHAQNEHLVFTDADCQPADSLWLQRFAMAFESGADFALGTGLFRGNRSLLHRTYRLDAARIAMFYLAANALGSPYMAVARSMAYRKSLFDKAGGFKSHSHIPSGDDDLFLQSVADHARVVNVPDAMTWSSAPDSWSAWQQQKLRHTQTGAHYPRRWVVLLGLYDLSAIVMWLGLATLIHFRESGFMLFFLLLLLRVVLIAGNLWRVDRLTGAGQELWQLFFGEIILSFWNPLLSIASQMTGRTEWRSRT